MFTYFIQDTFKSVLKGMGHTSKWQSNVMVLSCQYISQVSYTTIIGLQVARLLLNEQVLGHYPLIPTGISKHLRTEDEKQPPIEELLVRICAVSFT